MSKIIVDCNREDNYSVAILDNNGELDYFGVESKIKKNIKSNIYLGKITRVEHSLQAAFVEYGGDKAGFLPFGEIHPNYYQLPIRYKQELMELIKTEEDDNNKIEDNNDDIDDENDEIDRKEKDKLSYNIYKKYSIQEVIKRGQTVLVQVYKDERGNKGVSLTTYISLPGRYCVLMPNSPRGIGVSKKIFSYEDRKKILNIIREFEIPSGTGLIVRTAGLKATKEDLKKDYNYLLNLWDDIKQKVIHSKVGDAPLYEELDVVSQVVRDNYESDSNSAIVISGKEGYNNVIKIVNKLMPQESVKVKLYNEKTPIFKKFGIDKKLEELLDPIAPLPSGGYLVINPTEALVSIDVNSGKAIHGKNIEETALNTNLEAAKEVARQLRLRNLGGLIVVDFIDMDEIQNRRLLEKELRRVFMFDKAKVQFAKISQFGLVEISRQRMHTTIADMLTVKCDHCNGTGLIKAPSVIVADILDNVKEKLQSTNFVKKEFIEIMACSDILDYMVASSIKEIEAIQKKYNVKIITSKHTFDKNEEFIIRSLDEIGNNTTAIELYHSVVAKFEVAVEEKRERKGIFKIFGKLLCKNKNNK